MVKKQKLLNKILKDYHINLFYSEEEEGYIADIPDLAHCSAFGLTPSEAHTEVLKAKEVWIQTAKNKKRPVPEPRYRTAIYKAA